VSSSGRLGDFIELGEERGKPHCPVNKAPSS
jgi:hypothetical protein